MVAETHGDASRRCPMTAAANRAPAPLAAPARPGTGEAQRRCAGPGWAER